MKNQATDQNNLSKAAMQEMAKRMYNARFNELRAEGLTVRKATDKALDELQAIVSLKGNLFI